MIRNRVKYIQQNFGQDNRNFTQHQTSQWYDSATDRTIAAASVERGFIIHLNGAGPLEHRKCNQKLKTHDEWQAKKRTY